MKSKSVASRFQEFVYNNIDKDKPFRTAEEKAKYRQLLINQANLLELK